MGIHQEILVYYSGDYYKVYQCNHQLAEYFQSTGDKWLSDHFYQNCLKFSADVKTGEGKMAAQGHCNVGQGLEEKGGLLSEVFSHCLWLKGLVEPTVNR